jgi:biopolymer transport protein ExbB/TolQ
MLHFFGSGGPFMWPLLFVAISIIILSIKKAIELFGKQDLNQPQLERGINAIIFWGGISVILGFFAHLLGVYLAMQAISKAHEISPAIVAEGYAMSLTTILFGLFIFLFAAIFWFVLRWKFKQLIMNSE